MSFCTRKSIKKILFWDRFFQKSCYFSNLLLVFSLITFFLFITYKAAIGISHYGLYNLFGHFQFNLNASNQIVSFWSPLIITIFLSFFVCIICLPLAIKASIWLTFDAKGKVKNICKFLIDLLTSFPSIIFGVFARYFLADTLKTIFNTGNTLNITLAIIILIFMTVPLIISLLNIELSKQEELIHSGMALGLNKKTAIYKLALPNIKKIIIISTAIVFNKVISESVALSFLLSNENYQQIFNNGFISIFSSKLNSIAPLISENFFSDGANPNTKNLLFTFGFFLILVSISINRFILSFIKEDKKIRIFSKAKEIILFSWLFICKKLNYTPHLCCVKNNKKSFYLFKASIKHTIQKLLFFNRRNFFCRYVTLNQYIYLKFKKNKIRKTIQFIRSSIEILSIAILLAFIISILASIAINGIIALMRPNQTYGSDTIFRALLNTLVIVIISISIAFPIATFSAAYLSEYKKDGIIKRMNISLINISTSTPSIIFGIFGLTFFIHQLGLTVSGIKGKSLLAGILTISLMVTPHLMKLFYNYFSNIPKDQKDSSYSLGMTKSLTFFKVIVPSLQEEIACGFLLCIGKILGETAPLYLTSGLNSVSITNLMYPGQTLTTRIYSQLFNSKIDSSWNKIFETSLVLIITTTLIIFTIKVAIPFIHQKSKYSLKTLFLYSIFWLKYKYHLIKQYLFKQQAFNGQKRKHSC